MKAFAAMSRSVVCISPSDSLADAFEIMTEWEIRHLPVMAGEVLVGILSDRDVIVWASLGVGDRLVVPAVPVREAMTANPLTCGSFTEVGKIAELMVSHKIDSLPIVDDSGVLVGLVTSSDLLELLSSNEKEAAKRPLPFQWQMHLAARPGMARTYA